MRNTITRKCSILHYLSIKTKRVCRFALAAELLSMIGGLDAGFICRDWMENILGKGLALRIYTDSRSLFHLAISLTRQNERRMQIDLQVLRQAYALYYRYCLDR